MSTFTKLAAASFISIVCLSTAALSAECDGYSFASRTYAYVLLIKNGIHDAGLKGTVPFCKAGELAIETAAQALKELRAHPKCDGKTMRKLWASRSDEFETKMNKELYGC